MKDCSALSVNITQQQINAHTLPAGPRGIGIKSVSQQGNTIIFTFDDDAIQEFEFPDWWFGTRAEYNALTPQEKTEKNLYFIEEGS